MNRVKSVMMAVLASIVVLGNSAYAALPAEIATEFTGLETDITTLLGYVFSAILVVAVGFKLQSLVKRAIGRV